MLYSDGCKKLPTAEFAPNYCAYERARSVQNDAIGEKTECFSCDMPLR